MSNYLFYVIATLWLTVLPPTRADEGKAAPGNGKPVSIVILDDVSGDELRTEHGITPLSLNDLTKLINAVVNHPTSVRLGYSLVDGDVSPRTFKAVEIAIPVFAETPPVVDETGGTLADLEDAREGLVEKYRRYLGAVGKYKRELIATLDVFCRDSLLMQMETIRRFADAISANHGRDFNRSDVAGALICSSAWLGREGKTFLIVHSDCVDLPTRRSPRTTPLNAEEFGANITLIFVNKSGLPDKSQLFATAENPRFHADTLEEAVSLIAKTLEEERPTP